MERARVIKSIYEKGKSLNLYMERARGSKSINGKGKRQ
jgi:hypothetical protein